MKSGAKISTLFALGLSLFFYGLAWSDGTGLAWSTFLGGSDSDESFGLACDGSGNAYVTGYVLSDDFPTTAEAFDTSMIGSCYAIFVTKINFTGSDLVYSTFLGGTGPNGDFAYGIAVDNSGHAYVTGDAGSVNFPITSGAFDTTFNGNYDAFVTKLTPDGSDLSYSTFLGGTGYDGGYDITINEAGNAYVTGVTPGYGFPVTAGAFDTTHNGGQDVFVAKLNLTGSDLLYATFLGGSGGEQAWGVAVDNSGQTYVTGTTGSSDFPTTSGAFDVTLDGEEDAFIAKFDLKGSDLLYATFLGGSSREVGNDIAVSGDVFVTGYTESDDFPATAGAFDMTHNGSVDAFVVKLNSAGIALEYATFLGGSDDDHGWSIAVDDSGNVYVNGQTCSADFPATAGAFQTTCNGAMDAFLARLNPSGNILDYATFLGGSGWDWGSLGIALGDSCKVYVTGGTRSADFPATTGAFDETYNGSYDVFVAKFDLSDLFTSVVLASFTAAGGQGCITLEWITASEIECHRWEIYRGEQEGGEFVKIGELLGQGSAETNHVYQWVDRQVCPEVIYFYKLRQVGFDGSEWWSHSVSAAASGDIPKNFTLHQNYPNPFNPATDITYAIPRDVHVILKVYNVLGAEVATLADESQEAGFYTVRWDAEELANGVYFCRLSAGDFGKTIKMVLLR
jgi:hypothetical protein